MNKPRAVILGGGAIGSVLAGLFTHLAGIQTSGTLAYHFDFFIDFSRPRERQDAAKGNDQPAGA